VWVSRSARAPGYVDATIANISRLPRVLTRLQ
jgi:hypothetical protein